MSITGEKAAASQMTDEIVISLDEVSKEDTALVGGKGANLGEMLQHGVNVPPGFVVTTRAYREFMARNGLYDLVREALARVDVNDSAALRKTSQQIEDAIMASPMPQEFKDAISDAYEEMGDGPIAARSSATAEDLAAASFAGQQRTTLNVRGTDSVLQAVQGCWASLFEARAIFYRETNGFRHDEVSIAVVVQRMVSSEVSGVMFTAEPSTYDRDTILIEAIYGLGEPIVSGALSPDAYTVSKAGPKIVSRHVVVQPWFLKQRKDGLVPGQETTFQEAVPLTRRSAQKVDDEDIIALAQQGMRLEQIYGGSPQDVEWAMAGGETYIVQTRPITTLRRPSRTPVRGPSALDAIVTGAAASPGIGAGTVRIVQNASQLHLVRRGDVLVTEMTTPDFVPAMKRAAAIVTDRGGRTCHAAIVSREMGIPCVVGTGNGTRALHGVPVVTVDGSEGKVYRGDVAAKLMPAEGIFREVAKLETRTRLYVNLADPDAAERVAAMHVDGVGLLRAEFIMAHIGDHPRAMLESGRGEEFTRQLAGGLETFAKAFSPRPVVYRFSDFKTNEYRNLRGGEAYEPYEENPMLGYRGCSRYLAERDAFELEVGAVKLVRQRYPNLWVMLPFVRTVEELQDVKGLLEELGLQCSEDFKLWMMLEVPSNVLLLDKFLDVGIDGVSIGSNDLTQLILGVDRDNVRLAELFDERDQAVMHALEQVIRGCIRRGVTASICGQAPSVYPELTRKLVYWGITSISVSPDMIQETRRTIFEAEKAGGEGGKGNRN
ncbi:MAG: phosphoenolpyruvate synthase [Chloroflexi bacterium]|nr:phosphoenolpyruvate synthase [Chloroflexota bacterium]